MSLLQEQVAISKWVEIRNLLMTFLLGKSIRIGSADDPACWIVKKIALCVEVQVLKANKAK